MNRQEPFIPIYDLSDSPPEPQPADELTFQKMIEDVLAAPIVKQDADALDQLATDYDGICICYPDGSYVTLLHSEPLEFYELFGV